MNASHIVYFIIGLIVGTLMKNLGYPVWTSEGIIWSNFLLGVLIIALIITIEYLGRYLIKKYLTKEKE